MTERDQIGTVLGEPRRQAGEWWYRVRFANGRLQSVPERNLEIYEGPQDVETLLLRGAYGNRETLTRLITVTKLQRPLSNNVYAFQSSRTEFHPHQLKAVLKYLDSPKSRLLIADEVGLGKTIEAGMILAEERARQDLRRVLVVCPAALRPKWQTEMRGKFDEDFEILDTARLRAFLGRFEERGEEAGLRGVISLQTLRGQPLLDELEGRSPHFDLVIIDEAHHLRNPETLSHRAGEVLSDCSDTIVLLTATPVHLGNQNLFYLLRLLDPEEFDELAAFERRLRANEHVISALRLLTREFPADLASCLVELRKVESSYEAGRFRNNPLYGDALRRLQEYDGSRRDHVVELQRVIAGLNVLGHIFTRTRKSEIAEKRALRNARAVRRQFSEREAKLYREICGFAADWYSRNTPERDPFTSPLGIEGFAAIMLKRQAASCLPALVEQSLTAEEPEPLDSPDNTATFADEDPPEETSRRVTSIKKDPEFRALVASYRDIEQLDTKYAALRQALDGLDAEQPGAKVVVFSYFKGTLKYLHRRLTDDGYRCLLVHGDIPSDPRDPERDERGKRFRAFETDPAIRILLSSEVGSEGLDLQFCHVLVNYDLPWNPMVVEQRIGRLDRFGQRSRTILIFNFAIPGTIEDRILRRLYERIRIFEQSVGDLEPILGGEILELERKLLTGRLTAEQEEAEIERVAKVLEARRQQMSELEGQSDRFIGHDEYFVQEIERVRRLGRFVSGDELRLLMEEFLSTRFPRSTLTPTQENGVLVLRTQDDLLQFLRRFQPPGHSPTLAFLAQATRPMEVTFQSDIAFRRREVEFLAVHHPLIRAIATHYAGDAASLHPVSRVSVRSTAAPPGRYLFLVHLLELKGVRNRLQFEPVIVSLDGGATLERPDAEALVTAMVTEGETLDPNPEMPESRMADLLSDAQGVFSTRLEEIQGDFRRTNEALAANRLASLEASYRIKLDRQRRRLQPLSGGSRDPRYLRMIEGVIRRLEGELDAKRREIERSKVLDLRHELLAGGIVEVKAA